VDENLLNSLSSTIELHFKIVNFGLTPKDNLCGWMIGRGTNLGWYSSIYALNDIPNNLEDYITVHNSIKGK